MLAIGTAARAGSFTHVHDVAATHGQAGWLAGGRRRGPGVDVHRGADIEVDTQPASESLHEQKRRVTRKPLADVLRADGYGVSNTRASELLRELKPELGGLVSPTGLVGVVPSGRTSP